MCAITFYTTSICVVTFLHNKNGQQSFLHGKYSMFNKTPQVYRMYILQCSDSQIHHRFVSMFIALQFLYPCLVIYDFFDIFALRKRTVPQFRCANVECVTTKSLDSS